MNKLVEPLAPGAARCPGPSTAEIIRAVGDDFKPARKHLLANLDGPAAWKHGRPTNLAMAA